MPASLRNRLWLTYWLLSLVILGTITLTLLLYLIRNPYEVRQTNLRIRLVATLLENRAGQLKTLSTTELQQQLERADEAFNVWIVVWDNAGTVLANSRTSSPNPVPGLNILFNNRIRLVQPLFKDSLGNYWLYQVRQLPGGNRFMVAAPRPRAAIFSLLREEIVRPFLVAALIALILGFLFTLWVAGWISKPLQSLGKAARQIARGQFILVQPEGPQEVKEVAVAFNEMTRRLKNSQQAQHDLIANVSHELKTPLTSIQGFSQAIVDGTVDNPEALKNAAGVIHSEAGRMNRLVVNLLDLARLDSDLAGMVLERQDLSQILHQVVSLFSQSSQAKSLNLIEEIQPGLQVEGDADKLTQLFTNLVDNACKFSPQGGKVTVRAVAQPKEITVQVIDQGPGISTPDLEHIFDRFYQSANTRPDNSQKGVGLGLAIARNITQAHHGTIRVNNNDAFEGGGCTFTVNLPMARV